MTLSNEYLNCFASTYLNLSQFDKQYTFNNNKIADVILSNLKCANKKGTQLINIGEKVSKRDTINIDEKVSKSFKYDWIGAREKEMKKM